MLFLLTQTLEKLFSNQGVPQIQGPRLVGRWVFLLTFRVVILYMFYCLVFSDRVELEGMVIIPTTTFGDQYLFFYKHSPLKIYSQPRNVCVPQIQSPRFVGMRVFLLTIRVYFLSLYKYIGFIPRRDCESSTEGGPIVFTYVLFLGRKRILDFQILGL